MEMNEQERKRANLRLALLLGGIALLISLWPLYVLNKWMAG